MEAVASTKRWYLPTKVHDDTFQKAVILIKEIFWSSRSKKNLIPVRGYNT